jgi:hypothetical protein
MENRKMKSVGIAIIALGLGAATSAQAQNARKFVPVPHTEGLMLGATTVITQGITLQGEGMNGQVQTNRGTGVGVQVGYGFTPKLLVFASTDISKQGTTYAGIDGDFGLTHLEAGGRYTFLQAGKRMVPYVNALVGKRALTASSNGGGISVTMRISGTELGAGGGVLYALSPKVSLDGNVSAVRGKFTTIELSGDVNQSGTLTVNSSTNLRLKVGFAWHPISRTPRT